MSTIAESAPAVRSESRAVSAVDWGLLILRVVLGIVFFVHGSQHVLGWFGGPGLAGFVSALSKGGIPAPLGYVAAFAEFLGGLGLIFGVLARLSALGIAITMLVAIFHVHLPNGFFMNWSGTQKGEGFEYHLLAIAICLTILLAGPGRLAIADIEARVLRK